MRKTAIEIIGTIITTIRISINVRPLLCFEDSSLVLLVLNLAIDIGDLHDLPPTLAQPGIAFVEMGIYT